MLGVAVGAFGLLDGSLLGYRQVFRVGLSVNGAGRREDDTLHAILGHQLEEVDQRHDVVFIVHQGLLHTFAHGLGSGKVDDALYAGVLLEYAFKSGIVAAVHMLETRTDAGDFLDSVDDIGVGVGEVVHNDNFVTLVLKFNSGV